MYRRTRWFSALTAVSVTVAGFAAALVASPANADVTVSKTMSAMIADLDATADSTTTYDRDLFPHWITASGHSCNTRVEVLQTESVTTTTGGTCGVTGGKWYSYYDGLSWTDPSDVDIDHFVPLKEAWRSGAWAWTTARRQSYANDLSDYRTLAAVTDNENQSKSDQDPTDWMPPLASVQCRYIAEWVAVKTRWSLNIDPKEETTLKAYVEPCGNPSISVVKVAGDTPGPTPTTSPTPSPTRTPTPSPTPTPTPTTSPTPGVCKGTNNTDVSIPDNASAVTSSIAISGCSHTAASSMSTVYVSIVHPFRGDVSIWLYAPDGSYKVLKKVDDADSADDIKETYTVDLSGETSNGTWKLSVKDNYADDTGNLDTWTLSV